MITTRRTITCEWPGCSAVYEEMEDAAGFPGWGHVSGFRLDGRARDLHLCPQHLRDVACLILGELGGQNGVDGS